MNQIYICSANFSLDPTPNFIKIHSLVSEMSHAWTDLSIMHSFYSLFFANNAWEFHDI